jgi:hypothetical protein
MNDWVAGYRAAMADLERIANSRGLLNAGLTELIADFQGDALVIEHANKATLQRRRLRAAQEEPLFEGSR